jgi:hypothetical protein
MFHPTTANTFSSALRVFRARTVTLATILCLVFARPVAAQDDNDPNAQLNQALGNLFGQMLSDAIKRGTYKNWMKLAPEVQECLTSEYNLDFNALADQGIGPHGYQVKDAVAECVRLTTPPPLQIDGFAEYPAESGVYTRTGPGLPSIGSRFVARVTASEARGETREARLTSLIAKVQSGCANQYSISVIHFFNGQDATSKANEIREKWADAEVECAIAPRDEDSADALIIDDLASNNGGAQFFAEHSIILNAPFDKAFESATAVLRAHRNHIAQSDKNKGVIVAGDDGGRSATYLTSYFVVLAPETDATARLTFKLVEGSTDPVRNGPTVFHPQDRGVSEARAQQFISEIQQRLGGGHV